jgi:hypothetical protein
MGRSVAAIYGPWVETDWESGLVARVRRWWDTPIPDLPDAALALFLRQDIGIADVLSEANMRLARGQPDGSEMYDGELAEAVRNTHGKPSVG